MIDSRIYVVTGCTGYVGSMIAKRLLDLNKRVIGFCRSREKANLIFKDKRPTFIYGDISNKDDINKCFDDINKFVVIHTVAIVSIGEVKYKKVYDVTVGGTKNLLEVIRGYKIDKYLQISSTDSLSRKVKLEPDLSNYYPNPKACHKGYSRAKSEADLLLMKECERGLNGSILMLPSVLGPGDYSNTHMSQMILDYINDKLPASLMASYNIVDIRDVCNIMDNIVNHSKRGAMYLFSTRSYKINEILSVISKKCNKKMLPTLPMWVAYLGLPFLTIYTKLLRKRPLYTLAALRALRADSNFPNNRAKLELGFTSRPLSETVSDQVDFLINKR